MAVSFTHKGQAANMRHVFKVLLVAVTALADTDVKDAGSTQHTDKSLLRREAAKDLGIIQDSLDQVTALDMEQLKLGANATEEEFRARQRLYDLQRQVEVAAIELREAKLNAAIAKGEISKDEADSIRSEAVPAHHPFGHIVPPWWGHWKWNNQFNALMYESNNGVSQAMRDPKGTVKTGLGSSKAMVDAVDVSPGTRIDFDEDSVNNEKDLRDAAYYTGGKWVWDRDHKVSRVHLVPRYDRQVGDGINPITKYYHALWKDPSTHLKSAYEPDFFRDNSEFFGPFRIDYDTNTIWLKDWNLLVNAPNPISSGRGNVMVGPDHFWTFATNSFVAGKENSVRGKGDAVLGGVTNMANGIGDSVAGGEGNAAKYNGASIAGGFHNEVVADRSHVTGGSRNRVEANWGSIAGGATNLITKEYAVVLGGDGNKAEGQHSAVHGGVGNKALAPDSTINGGEGGKTTKRYEVLTGLMPLEDQETEDKMEAMEAEVHQTGAAAPPS
jgi:hypothetical protein